MDKKLDIKAYLDADEKKDLLRLLTAGSVDDGKSTLIGRLLFDSKKLYDDQLAALERDSKRVGNAGDSIDYALLLDGLKAEREEGITIDVAYRYFSTNRRKFIIADTPGHEQYTRNMITGGSTANLAIILIDARKGVITQTRRHTFLVSLLGIKHIVLAVNKMDLVDFSQKVFDDIVAEYRKLTDHLGIDDITCFPLSAREGDNVVEKSDRTPWYDGPALLHFLETVPIHADRNFDDFRYPVQYVLRPDLNFRGFCGKVASGVVHVGDEVMALPSMKRSHVKGIVAPYCPPAGDNSSSLDAPHRGAKGDFAFPPQSVCLTLEDEIDISRGEMIVHPDNLPHIGRHFTTMLVWMDEEPMDTGKQFFLKHNTNTTRATICALRNRVDVNTLEEKSGQPFQLNEIGQVDILTAKTLFFDAYTQNRQTGSFILIDPITNNTSAVGMILAPLDESALENDLVPTLDLKRLGISEEHYDAIDAAVKDLSRQGIEVKVKY
ncbi:MAG: sulfate adenylyltransferase subunit CysN [Bacteroidaceae bacterium]|nr:sulfate adenylyltransferase subunit CysN [Bacteroidaceae bacterium]